MWVLVMASVFTISFDDSYPSPNVWLYETKEECHAKLIDIATYKGDGTMRTLYKDRRYGPSVKATDKKKDYRLFATCIRKEL